MAAKFTVKVLYNHLPRLSREAHGKAVQVVQKASHDVEAAAKNFVPVDTSLLKNSINVEFPKDLLGLIAPHTEYAVYVEYGTSRMSAQPYMTPAAEKVRPGFHKAMGDIVRD